MERSTLLVSVDKMGCYIYGIRVVRL